MKKYTVLFVLVLFLVFSQLAFGQGPKFGVGGNLGLPQGDWSDFVGSVAFGGTAQALFPLGENMAFGAQAGYMIFGGEKVGVPGFSVEWDAKAIPILGIFRYYLGVPGGPRPFVGGMAGFHLFTIDVTTEVTFFDPFTGQTQTLTAKGDANSTEFSFAPSAGIEIGAIEIAAAYMLISDANYIYARLGFNFGGQ